jgi:hypothetical protein
LAWTITKIGGKPNSGLYNEIVAQTRADIAALPTNYDKISFGSQCLCLEDSSVWILDGNNTWKEI